MLNLMNKWLKGPYIEVEFYVILTLNNAQNLDAFQYYDVRDFELEVGSFLKATT